ncbi:Tubulin beta chain [Verticillium dahliae VDG1]|nr:Tubulin beta chain [Verticillium dahliae VDG1]
MADSPPTRANGSLPEHIMTDVDLDTPPSVAAAATAPSIPSTPNMPSTPSLSSSRSSSGFTPLVTVVDFHHARGPECEKWFGVPEGSDPATDYDWGLLPFMALSDGAHASSEDFSYFTLLRPSNPNENVPATSLFGISCTRQLDAAQLLNRPADVTRSTVQKAVVVIADSPQFFGMMRERLSVVTQAWFAQRDFSDTEILRRFQDSLADEKRRGVLNSDEDRDQYLGMSLRELVREFRWQTLVLLKCCLLQPKMLFFGSRCERLCMMQFSLISLIPGLIRNLQDCADPEMNNYEKGLATPTTLRTSDRSSLLTYMGLPLQIFGKGSLFGPYTPLQQLDILADFGTKSYIVGSTNSLLLQQKDRYSDILIHLDDNTVNITSTSLRQALTLSAADRRWIDYLTQEVNDTWDEANPGRPKTMGYVGSEEFIRLQFEEYILSLISSFKYHKHLQANQHNPRALLPHIDGDPVLDFGADFIDAWQRTENHRMWNTHTDSHLFDVVEPKHPCAGGLTIDDVQRRIAQQVQDMHLDERFAVGREALGRNRAAGREKASTMFNKFYADMESYREAQRAKVEEQAAAARWVSWAGEKRRGWGSGWGARKSDKSGASSPASALSPREEGASRFSGSSFFPARNAHGQATAAGAGQDEKRPVTGNSFSESIFSSAGTTDSAPGSPRGFRPEEFIPRDVTHGRPEDKTEAPAPAPHGAKDEIVAATPTLEPVVEKADVKSETVTPTPEKVDVVPVRKTEMATPGAETEAKMEPEVVTATGEVVSSAPAADGVKV